LRRRAFGALLVLLLLSPGTATACTGGRPAAPDRLVIAAGPADDVYQVLGGALAEAARRSWSAEVDVLTTDGSVRNLQLVAEGQADVGFATVDAAADAISGNLPFLTALPVQALARLYDDYLQVVTLADGDIRELADLAGRRVSVGVANSGVDITANRVLRAEGVELGSGARHSPATSARALAAGEIDAFFVAGGLPTPVVSDLAAATPIRLLSMPELAAGLQDQYGEYYQAQTIPAGTYDLESEVETVGVPTILVVRRDLPEDTAYRLTELLFSAKSRLVEAHVEARRLDHRSAPATFPIELHPGAQRYYRGEKPFS
jgi:hypothetical protein